MPNVYTVFCKHNTPGVASSVLLVVKGPRKKCRVTAVVDGKLLTDPEDLDGYYSHTFIVQNPNKIHRVRILGLNAKKKVVSSISKRVS